MHTPLQIQERNALIDYIAKHPIYNLIKHVVYNTHVECSYLTLFPEDIFLEIMDLIDTIRENNNCQESINYINDLKAKLVLQYMNHAQTQEAKHEINLYVAEILYGASCALSIAKCKPYKEVATYLCDLLTIPQKHKLFPLFQRAIKQLTQKQFCDWDEYFTCNDYLTDTLIDIIENTDYCIYIIREAFVDNPFYKSIDEYEKSLKTYCSYDAPTLVQKLQQHEQIGYLDFISHSLRKIFKNLDTHFPNTIKYEYANFAAAAKKCNWHVSSEKA